MVTAKSTPAARNKAAQRARDRLAIWGEGNVTRATTAGLLEAAARSDSDKLAQVLVELGRRGGLIVMVKPSPTAKYAKQRCAPKCAGKPGVNIEPVNTEEASAPVTKPPVTTQVSSERAPLLVPGREVASMVASERAAVPVSKQAVSTQVSSRPPLGGSLAGQAWTTSKPAATLLLSSGTRLKRL